MVMISLEKRSRSSARDFSPRSGPFTINHPLTRCHCGDERPISPTLTYYGEGGIPRLAHTRHVFGRYDQALMMIFEKKKKKSRATYDQNDDEHLSPPLYNRIL